MTVTMRVLGVSLCIVIIGLMAVLIYKLTGGYMTGIILIVAALITVGTGLVVPATQPQPWIYYPLYAAARRYRWVVLWVSGNAVLWAAVWWLL